MRDLMIFMAGYFAPTFQRWLRRQSWFDRMTTYLAKQFDRLAGHT